MKFIPLKMKRVIKEGLIDLKNFGLKVMLARIYWILSDESIESIKYRNKVLVQWITQHYEEIIKKYQIKCTDTLDKNETSGNIWVFWWNGKKDMPDIIRMCHMSKKRCSSGHKLVLLSEDNLKDYVEFPDYVWELFNNRQLRIQHFADMIRVQLIQKYGGLWLDASVYCTKHIPEEIFEKEFFSISSIKEDRFVSECRWTTFVIGGCKDNILCSFLNEFFMEYCKSGKPFIDYYMFDCAIAAAYNTLPSVRDYIDQLEKTQNSCYWVNEHIEDVFEDYESIIEKQDFFQKISWGNLLNCPPKKPSLYNYLWQKETYEKS